MSLDPPREAADAQPAAEIDARALSLALVIVSACIAAACSSGTKATPEVAVDLSAEKEALLKRDNEWHAAVAEKKDIAKITSFFASDGIMIGSGQSTAAGRVALTQAVGRWYPARTFKTNGNGIAWSCRPTASLRTS